MRLMRNLMNALLLGAAASSLAVRPTGTANTA